MVEIEIDGKKVEVPPGSMVMDAANKVGTYIPHFCYHKKLSIAANCRMCLVEVEKAPKPLPACATPVAAGMIVRSNSEKAVQAQKSVMEFLLINHPLDCPICDQGGECQLQDLAMGYGPSASRYQEEKRVVFHKNVGPLISMEEMSRCIHCTRCVRFGQEIAGVMELGMLNRGEHSEITSFVGKTVDSELSGNMIDLCPVGALTSKPFRYSARTWELGRRKSVSPHDAVGANLIVQVKNNQVKRVVPLENEAVNECWISDKDRFSYEALNSEERLQQPMLKQGGQWQTVDWKTALEYVAHGLRNIRHEHGADAIGALVSPHATLEEMALAAKLMRAIGSDNIDSRLRQSDFSLDGKIKPWLGMHIEELGHMERVLVIGAFLRKDHPLLSARLRQAVKHGAKLMLVHGCDDDNLIPAAAKMIAAPSDWLAALSKIVVALAARKQIAAPAGFDAVQADDAAHKIAELLDGGEGRAILLGNAAVAHPEYAKLHAAAEWIAANSGAKFGVLGEAANSVGAYLAKAVPQDKGANAFDMIAKPRKAYLVLHAEAERDCHDTRAAAAAMQAAEMVVLMSPFKQGMDYADVILPVAPFTETAGSFVNCEGRLQSFQGVVKALGETRPAWKVLRVLGNLLDAPGFDYDSAEQVRAEITKVAHGELISGLNNQSGLAPQAGQAAGGLQRLADVPIYFADALVRRAPSLQATADAKAPRALMNQATLAKHGLQAGDAVTVRQGQGSASLLAALHAGLPDDVVRIAAAHESTAQLGAMFGAVTLEKGKGA
ncbi:NADH-quinone oxidoreductase subunit NuoG [Massilia sp. W12]|uniref:NADH-quinone oxidoreductase subunit NuoG n=1 Tax=Massilia sp. W12 TaxID=3126507 RepID=UPI0030D4135D